MKVYELAKKLEVKSVFLMNKIRKEWKLPVKTHMETLTPSLVKKIEENFYADQKNVKKPVKKRKASTKKTTIRKTSTKKVVTKKATKEKDVAHLQSDTTIQKPLEGEAPPVKRKNIIRRSAISKKSNPSATPTLETSDTTTKESASPSLRPASSKSIRLDLVSVKTTNPLEEDFWDEKTDEKESSKKSPKKPIAEKDVSSKFNATDFRKREVIFQPRKKRTNLTGEFKKTLITKPKSHKRIIKIHGEMNIENLCQKMGLKRKNLLKKLKEEGLNTKDISSLDFDTIALIIPSFGFEAKNTKQTEEEILKNLQDTKEEKKKAVPKAPVVTIMGHVDHGKTTLLDSIRKTQVTKGEAGGITQHIGAYSVSLDGKPITFIDTPGHEAFTSMRARGANVTDIVVILVAGSEGVQPQTLEALNHAKSAKTPIIVVISKMDAPGANPDKIKQQMSEQEIVPEDWGGDTSFIPISALKGEGIKELLEQIQLIAEMQELKCHPEEQAKGAILEARKEKGLGSIVSLLVQEGTLKKGDTLIAGECFGRVRKMTNDKGEVVQKVLPGFPVEVIGFQELPQAGDVFHVVKDEKSAKDLLTLRKDKPSSLQQPALTPEEMLIKMQATNTEKKELNIILKTDVRGSLEAIKNSLEKLTSEEVNLRVIHSGAGAITESDVLLASTVSGTIFGFNVRPDGKASKTAKEKSVDIHTYSVIYELLDHVKQLMLGLLKSEWTEEDLGQAEVREIFHISKVGTVAGCYIIKGQIPRNAFIRLVRDGRLVHDGVLSSLKRFKEDVKQVGTGMECGISLEKFNDIKPKDILEAYTKKEKKRTEL